MYSQSIRRGGGSEVEQTDKVLWGEGGCAAFWVVGRARMVSVLRNKESAVINLNAAFSSRFQTRRKAAAAYLPEKDVAVRAEVQRVAVLLSERTAAAQLEVHLLPLQVTFVRHHQTLTDLKQEGRNQN